MKSSQFINHFYNYQGVNVKKAGRSSEKVFP